MVTHISPPLVQPVASRALAGCRWSLCSRSTSANHAVNYRRILLTGFCRKRYTKQFRERGSGVLLPYPRTWVSPLFVIPIIIISTLYRVQKFCSFLKWYLTVETVAFVLPLAASFTFRRKPFSKKPPFRQIPKIMFYIGFESIVPGISHMIRIADPFTTSMTMQIIVWGRVVWMRIATKPPTKQFFKHYLRLRVVH